jgi:outer membrane immunogenic protein
VLHLLLAVLIATDPTCVVRVAKDTHNSNATTPLCDRGPISASLVIAVGAARADGYVAKGPAPVMLTVSSWTGAYGGVNGGYGWNGNAANVVGDATNGAGTTLIDPDFTSRVSGVLTQFSQGLGTNGFVGGGQLGYNWQIARDWVAGLETDLQYSGVDGDGTTVGRVGGLVGTFNADQELKWFGTLRGRLGFLATEHLLLFGTAGLAYGKTEVSADSTISLTAAVGGAPTVLSCFANQVCIAGSNSKTSVGWTAGLGFEWIVWRDVTLKGEYLHVDLGDQNVTLVAQPPAFGNGFANANFDNSYEIIRAGLNFRFPH